MSSLWIFICLLSTMVFAGTSPDELYENGIYPFAHTESSQEFHCIDTKEYLCQVIENKCNCVKIRISELSFDKWYVLNSWMKTCIEQYDEQSSSNKSDIEIKWYQPDGVIVFYNRWKDGISDMYYVHLSLEDIAGILRAIQSYRLTYQTYLGYYRNATYGKFNSSCNDAHYMTFIDKNGQKLANIYNDVWWVCIFQKYIQVAITLIVLFLGVLMTGTLLFIFVAHKEMRIEANVILLNIAICDFLHIIVLYPIFFVFFNGICSKYELFRVCGDILFSLSSANALSILALSLQRLFVVKGYLKNTLYSRIRKVWRITLLFLIVWSPGIIYISFMYIFCLQEGKTYFVGIDLVTALMGLFIFLLPISITAINCMTSTTLKRSTKEVPGEQIHHTQIESRYRSAKVVNWLCVLYWATHFPQYIGLNLAFILLSDDISDIKFKYLTFSMSIMFCLNAIFNPLALVIMSKNFKRLYLRYLFRCSQRYYLQSAQESNL